MIHNWSKALCETLSHHTDIEIKRYGSSFISFLCFLLIGWRLPSPDAFFSAFYLLCGYIFVDMWSIFTEFRSLDPTIFWLRLDRDIACIPFLDSTNHRVARRSTRREPCIIWVLNFYILGLFVHHSNAWLKNTHFQSCKSLLNKQRITNIFWNEVSWQGSILFQITHRSPNQHKQLLVPILSLTFKNCPRKLIIVEQWTCILTLPFLIRGIDSTSTDIDIPRGLPSWESHINDTRTRSDVILNHIWDRSRPYFHSMNMIGFEMERLYGY